MRVQHDPNAPHKDTVHLGTKYREGNPSTGQPSVYVFGGEGYHPVVVSADGSQSTLDGVKGSHLNPPTKAVFKFKTVEDTFVEPGHLEHGGKPVDYFIRQGVGSVDHTANAIPVPEDHSHWPANGNMVHLPPGEHTLTVNLNHSAITNFDQRLAGMSADKLIGSMTAHDDTRSYVAADSDLAKVMGSRPGFKSEDYLHPDTKAQIKVFDTNETKKAVTELFAKHEALPVLALQIHPAPVSTPSVTLSYGIPPIHKDDSQTQFSETHQICLAPHSEYKKVKDASAPAPAVLEPAATQQATTLRVLEPAVKKTAILEPARTPYAGTSKKVSDYARSPFTESESLAKKGSDSLFKSGATTKKINPDDFAAPAARKAAPVSADTRQRLADFMGARRSHHSKKDRDDEDDGSCSDDCDKDHGRKHGGKHASKRNDDDDEDS